MHNAELGRAHKKRGLTRISKCDHRLQLKLTPTFNPTVNERYPLISKLLGRIHLFGTHSLNLAAPPGLTEQFERANASPLVLLNCRFPIFHQETIDLYQPLQAITILAFLNV